MPFRRRVLFLLLALVLPFSLIELLIITLDVAPRREPPLVIWNPQKDDELIGSEGEFRFHPRWLWEPRPGAIVHGDAVNADAYRGPRYPLEKTPGRLRIAALGDSSTYAIGFPEAIGWARQLEMVLRADGHDVEVLNFGVVGFTLEQGLELFEGRVRAYRPDVVIAAFGAINDSVRASAGLADRPKIDRTQDPLYRLRAFLQRYATFRCAEDLARRTVRSAEDIKKDRVLQRVPTFRFNKLLELLDDAVRADGAALVLVSPPRRMEVEYLNPQVLRYTEALMEFAQARVVPLADVRAVLRALDEERLGGAVLKPDEMDSSPLFIDPYHPSAEGHALYADTVARALKEHGVIP